jgi:exodeoxyribonuclease V alpha subunit
MARMSEKLHGSIERVTFHSPETGYAVLRVIPRGKRGIVTVVGKLVSVTAGEQLEATGSWVFDPQHGEQFRADEILLLPPSTIEGIEKYLGSGLVKGIGPKYARKIVEAFGERTLQVIDESPSFLKEVKGIGAARISRIRESWREQRAVRDIMIFLQEHGLGTARAVRIYKTYGDQAVEIVRSNPYRLATDIWGVGFKTADELGRRLGIDPASPQRARAAVRFTLQKLSQEGHVGCPEEGVIAATLQGVPDLPEPVTRAAGEDLRKEGEIVREPGSPPWLYLKPLFLAELGIARAIHKLQQGDHPLPRIDVEAAIRRVEAKMELELADNQRNALRAVTREKVLVITGGPGTGKTTLVHGILDLFTAHGLRCALCAPTGRAARRLSETTGREGRTIHRLLEFDSALGGFKRTDVHPLDLDLLVVDETSMVDVALMNSLLRAVPAHACVVLVGDVDQLPSVGPGTVLADLIASGVPGVVRLTQIFRQASQSWIVRAAHAIKEGELPESAPAGGTGDFYFIEVDSPGTIIERILTLVRERIPQCFGLDSVRDVQVLTPMNRSELGTQALNQRLQEALNPHEDGPQVERFGWSFRVGDKVMQTQNNYTREVFNGDVGRVSRIHEAERELVIDYDGREVVYDFGELDEVTLCWASTIHKGQGSEYPAVVIPLHTQHFKMLQRNLLYTAVTRGKRLVVLVGSRQALELAVRNVDTSRRYSLLEQRLRKAAEEREP